MKNTPNGYELAAKLIDKFYQKAEGSKDPAWYDSSQLKATIDEKLQNGPPSSILDFIEALQVDLGIKLIDSSVTFLPGWKFRFSIVDRFPYDFCREESFCLYFSCLSNFYTFFRATSFQVPVESKNHSKTWLSPVINERYFAPFGFDLSKVSEVIDEHFQEYRYLSPITCVRQIAGYEAPFILRPHPCIADFLFGKSDLTDNPTFRN